MFTTYPRQASDTHSETSSVSVSKTHFKFIKLLPFICFVYRYLLFPASVPENSARSDVYSSTFHLIKLDQIEKSHLMGEREEKKEVGKKVQLKTKIY